MSRLLLLAVLCSGCTVLFGLDHVSSVDKDNDGVDDDKDNCPDDYNPDQSDYNDNGIGDRCDTCTSTDPTDTDHDGIPDACDGCIGIGVDADHDGIDDACDPCVASGVDADHDGIDDACDPCIGNSGIDLDADGIDDACDTCVTKDHTDSDGDGLEDTCDLCNSTAPKKDIDHDGIEDACDPCVCPGACMTPTFHDEDGDGIDDGCDNCKQIPNKAQADVDNDGLGDACDLGGSTREAIFDAFVTEDPLWYQTGESWAHGVDTWLYAGTTPKASATYRVYDAPLSGKLYVTAVLGGAALLNADHVEVMMADGLAQPATNFARCGLVGGNGLAAPQLTLYENGMPPITVVVVDPAPTEKFALTVSSLAKFTCTITYESGAQMSTPGGAVPPLVPWYPGIAAGGTASAIYYSFGVITAQ